MSARKDELWQRAKDLRAEGYFYGEIAEKFGVAKSSAFLWSKDVEVSESGKDLIRAKRREINKKQLEIMHGLQREQIAANNQIIVEHASRILGELDLSTSLKRMICAVMIWCEGTKNVKNGVRFINSDPVMVKTFMALFRESFAINEARLRVLVHLHEYHDVKEQLEFWSNVTKIPLTQFTKPYLKPHTGKNTRPGYPGCISIRYADSSLGKLIKMLYTEYGKMH